jgi:hypothetical protein
VESWKALLDHIYPGAAPVAVPGESVAGFADYREPPKDPDPLRRIHLMRKIKSGASGFARLYGAKDLEQFKRQSDYMWDFHCAKDRFAEIAFHDTMPVYADMSVAQLQYYFCWRTQIRGGVWEPAPLGYALLYLFELMNRKGSTPALAQGWLRLRESHPRLDTKMTGWFKDYWLCYENDQDFYELALQSGLGMFYTREPEADALRFSSYPWQDSRFFQEFPEAVAALKRALTALPQNLEPLFRLYGLPPNGKLNLQPARFSYYEPFSGAAVQAPELPGSLDLQLSPGEHYRLRGGAWSRALEDALRPPSHGIGFLVKRTEANLRELAGFRSFPSSGEPTLLLERWAQQLGPHVRFFDMIRDARFDQIIDECARAAWEHTPPQTQLLPQSAAILKQLNSEPMRTLLRLREIGGAPEQKFLRQGKLLVGLEDNFAEEISCDLKRPSYDALNFDQLRSYLTWRTRWQHGEVKKTDSAYVKLYCCELLCEICSLSPFDELCCLLRKYAAVHDRHMAKCLVDWIRDFYVLRHPADSWTDLLQKNRVETWFPAQFIFCAEDQLAIFEQISSYKLTASRFFLADQYDFYKECFHMTLNTTTEFLRAKGFDLPKLMSGQQKQNPPWLPWRALPIALPQAQRGAIVALGPNECYQYSGREWRCLKRPELPAWAASFAAFLLKFMEQTLRIWAKYPYTLSLNTPLMLQNLAMEHKELYHIVCSASFSNYLKSNIVNFADVQHFFAPKAKKPKLSCNSSSIEGVLKPFFVDFTKLERIRAEAHEATERLIIEKEEEIEPIPTPIFAEPAELGGWEALIAALNTTQIACINAVFDGKTDVGNSFLLEEINELSLELIGDNLIDTAHETPYLYKEYAEKWRADRHGTS